MKNSAKIRKIVKNIEKIDFWWVWKNQSFENFFERFWFSKRFRWNHCAAIYHNVIPRIHHFIYRALARSFGYKTPIFHSRYSPSITPSIADSHDYLHMRNQNTRAALCNLNALDLWMQVHGAADSKIMPFDLFWPPALRDFQNMWQILYSIIIRPLCWTPAEKIW